VLVALALAAACGDDDNRGDGSRRDQVARKGQEVMPFDLGATTHQFEPTADGLVETVDADDPGDRAQIRLIRRHLAHEAATFRAGDYGDPARIHGHDMPGLATLESNPDAVTVTYMDRPAGARLTFTSDDPALVTALHAWSQAQTMDHAGD
jgi:hypothetical protein